ncbi:hypothetical protein TNCV_2725711 [Trichonephila clavipes]|nr:hypothetical protein TNCV_2725711 [Trichonephila clavipes]
MIELSGHELMLVVPRIRALVPIQTHRAQGLIHENSVGNQNIFLGGMWNFREEMVVVVLASSLEHGRGSLMVKVTDSWQGCHEFEPSTAENTPCRDKDAG